MKHFLFLLPAVLVLLLSGCGQGTSISSLFSSESSSKSSEDDSIKRSKTISADSSAKTVSTVAAATYIFGALSHEYQLPAGFEKALIASVSASRDHSSSVALLQKRFELSDEALTASLCLLALRPRMGWPLDPMEQSPARQSFLRVTQASAILANNVGTLVAEQLASSVYRDTDTATAAALAAFHSLDHPAIKHQWVSDVAGFKLGSVDLASDGNVHFTSSDGMDVSADQNGFKFSKAGHPYFGQDVLSSRKIELSFESSSATRMQRSRDLTSSEGTDQNTSRKSTVEIK